MNQNFHVITSIIDFTEEYKTRRKLVQILCVMKIYTHTLASQDSHDYSQLSLEALK